MFRSPEFKHNPYPTYSQLRSKGRIHWINNASGGAWLLAHYTDVVQALNDPHLSSCRSHIAVDRLPPDVRKEFSELNQILSMWLINTDPPQHTRLRKLLNKGFSPSLLRAMRPRIQKITDSLLDKDKDAGQLEFMRDFAYLLPVLVIAEMLGVDPIHHADFITWSDDMVNFLGAQPTLNSARRAQNSLIALTEYFRVLLPRCRQEMGEDLLSLLIRIKEQEGVLTLEQLLAQCSLLLMAGHETTRNFLGNSLLTLLQHPDQLEFLKKNPSGLPNALRELLRYESPMQFIARLATSDIPSHKYGQPIKQGQVVYLLMGSANHDPAKFTDPDTLDVTRKSCPHLAFGSGPHFCLGAQLAYLEAEIALKTIFRRMPNLHLVDEIPDWSLTGVMRSLNKLMLTF